MNMKRSRTASLRAALGDDLLAAGDLGGLAEAERAAERRAACRTRCRRVGFEPQPEVVSLSPHLVETQSSAIGHDSRCFSLAHCTYSRAACEARMIVSWSPWPSMPKPTTGLPVSAMPSTTFLVQPSSMPMTTTAATFGLQPAPIRVRKCRSRSAPNWSRPYGCGIASAPLMLFATASAAAFERSSSGRMMTWLRTPTRPFSRR